MCVCFIATRGTLQHVSAYMGHHQVIFYNTAVAIDGFTSLPISIIIQFYLQSVPVHSANCVNHMH
jgi:hypothetical protein